MHTYKSTNNEKFRDMPEKDAGSERETGNLFWSGLSSRTPATLKLIVAVATIQINRVICLLQKNLQGSRLFKPIKQSRRELHNLSQSLP